MLEAEYRTAPAHRRGRAQGHEFRGLGPYAKVTSLEPLGALAQEKFPDVALRFLSLVSGLSASNGGSQLVASTIRED